MTKTEEEVRDERKQEAQRALAAVKGLFLGLRDFLDDLTYLGPIEKK